MPTLDPNRIISGIIYGLHNGDGEIRYIGYTTMTVARRLNAHKCAARTGKKRPVCDWMTKYGLDSIQMVVLSTHKDIPYSELQAIEVKAIAKGYQDGIRLLNVTSGGEGGATRTGVKHTTETRARMSATAKGKPKSAAHRKALSEGQMGRIAHNKGKTMTEEQRAKMRYQRHVTMHVSKGIVGPRCTNCGTRKESPYNAERPLEYSNVA